MDALLASKDTAPSDFVGVADLVGRLRILLAALLSGDRYGHRCAITVADSRRPVFTWKTALVSEGSTHKKTKSMRGPSRVPVVRAKPCRSQSCRLLSRQHDWQRVP